MSLIRAIKERPDVAMYSGGGHPVSLTQAVHHVAGVRVQVTQQLPCRPRSMIKALIPLVLHRAEKRKKR